MKKPQFVLMSVVVMLSAATLRAEKAVVLEDFENSIDAASQGDWGGSRIPDNVTLKQYTRTGPEDRNVTHGNKSLQVNLTGSEGWVLDYKITFSDEASKKIHEAAKSTDVARYILRYDLIFPGGTAWMNSQVFLGDLNDQVDTPSAQNGGKVTMSIALDLVTGIADDGPMVLRLAHNFDATEDPFIGPLTVYLDNIRLVDTYAAGAKPVTYVLQGFENSSSPTGGAADFTDWGGTPRATYKQYTAAGPDDIRVSEGTHALQVDYAGAGFWKADFRIPFAGTKLADILKLDLPAKQRPTAAELERYTFRFDITYPDRDENGKPSWEVTSYNTLSVGYPFSQARRDSAAGRRQTVSTTLDQITWSDSAEGKPVLMFIANADWSDPGSTLYYDNFRIIDTGATGTTTGDLKITSFSVDAKAGTLTLKWSSAVGKNYAVDYTQTLGSWPTVLVPSIAGADGTTTYTVKLPSSSLGFLRVRPTN